MSRADAVNTLNLTAADYKGNPTTLCQGCGHNAVARQIAAIAYELSIKPSSIIKLSGIGCSSKSPAYFLGRSHGFNALHGRMPSIGTGALVANRELSAIGVSGDGDTANIGFSQFKHSARRNLRMVYLVENNGVYGLTKGQFSATADYGQMLKYAGINDLPPTDLCAEAILSGAGFVARSFSGDPKQLRELLKAALSHRGIAVIDIISPCVTFNNRDEATKSYGWGKEHEEPLHGVSWLEPGFVPPAEQIEIGATQAGEVRNVRLHDGSTIQLRRVEEDYDPSDKVGALQRLQEATDNGEFITGLIYYEGDRPSLVERLNLSETPLVALPDEKLRPSREALDEVMSKFG